MSVPVVGAILGIGEKLIERLFPDQGQRAEALLKLKELEQSGDLAVIAHQTEINKIEAGQANPFISGWRPFIGWTCGAALAVNFVLGPLLEWVSGLFGHTVPMPKLEMMYLLSLLGGMLGLGGLRTVEKLQGVASK